MQHEQMASHIFKVSKRHTSKSDRFRPRETQDEAWIKPQKSCRSRPSHRANCGHSHVTAHPKTPDLGQATVQIIQPKLGHVTVQQCHLISAKLSCKSFSHPSKHQHVTVRISLQAHSWLWARPPVLSPVPLQANHSHVSTQH